MGRRSLLGPLRHSRWDSAASAALGGPVVAGDDGLGPGEGRDQRAGDRAGAGVAHVPGRAVAAGLSDAGAPARPDNAPPVAGLLTAEMVASGYTAYWVGDQLRLAHRCRNVAGIANPTSALVSWHLRTHRCGTPESAWHVGGTPERQRVRRDPTRPAHLVRRPQDRT